MSGQIELKDVMLSDEYFEARGGDVKKLTAEWIAGYYGDRCEAPDQSGECPICKQWGLFDLLFGDVP